MSKSAIALAKSVARKIDNPFWECHKQLTAKSGYPYLLNCWTKSWPVLPKLFAEQIENEIVRPENFPSFFA